MIENIKKLFELFGDVINDNYLKEYKDKKT